MPTPLEYARPKVPTKSSKAVWALAISAMVCGVLSGPIAVAPAILPSSYDLTLVGGHKANPIPLAVSFLLGAVAQMRVGTSAVPALRIFSIVGFLAPIVWIPFIVLFFAS
jgi:hypothetical protein